MHLEPVPVGRSRGDSLARRRRAGPWQAGGLPVKIAIRIPWCGTFGKGDIADIVRIADQAGFHSGWVGDHVVYPVRETTSRNDAVAGGKYRQELMSLPTYEAFALLAFAAAFSERVRLGIGCCVVPQRSPVLLAKQVASIDQLSGGRVILGAVGGWLAEEFQALGASFADRRSRLEESIAVMRACWEQDEPAWQGSHHAFAPLRFLPKTAQQPLPIWFGGHSDTALRRAARLGQGWFGSRLAADDAAVITRRLRAYRAAGERSTEPLTVMVSSAGRQPTDRSEIEDRIALYASTGVDVLLLDSNQNEGRAIVALAAAAAEVVG
jgi:probable F420-dependent oxidoreductase